MAQFSRLDELCFGFYFLKLSSPEIGIIGYTFPAFV